MSSLRITTTQIDDDTRRRMLANSEGVLVFHERLRELTGGKLWCIVGLHLVRAKELWMAADDVQAAWLAARAA